MAEHRPIGKAVESLFVLSRLASVREISDQARDTPLHLAEIPQEREDSVLAWARRGQGRLDGADNLRPVQIGSKTGENGYKACGKTRTRQGQNPPFIIGPILVKQS